MHLRLSSLDCLMRTETDACPEQALIAGKAKSKSKGAALTRRAECLEPRRRCITKWFSGGCVRKADLTSLRAAREAPAATHLPPPAELQSSASGRPHVARDPRESPCTLRSRPPRAPPAQRLEAASASPPALSAL